jgi:hypothetical protein
LVVNLCRHDALLPAVVDCSNCHAVDHARVVFGSLPDLPVIINVLILLMDLILLHRVAADQLRLNHLTSVNPALSLKFN